MKTHVLLLAFLLGVGTTASAQTLIIEGKVTVSDGAGGIQELFVGLAVDATDTLDALLGEEELPPPPPIGIFDARFIGSDVGINLGQGTLRDYRQGDSVTYDVRVHELNYQVGSGSEITIDVDLPATMSIRVQDIITGTIIDTVLRIQDSYSVANPGAISKLKLTVSYKLGRLAAPVLIYPADGAVGVEGAPTLLWHSVDIATAYHLVVAPDSFFSQVVVDTIISDTSFTLPLLEPLSDYWWQVAALNATVEDLFSAPWRFTTGEWLGVDEGGLPREYVLSQNYPNPFNPSTTIRYALPEAAYVRLTVFNTLGQEVTTLIRAEQKAGYYEAVFNAAGLASGVYVYRLRAGSFVLAKKLVLTR